MSKLHFIFQEGIWLGSGTITLLSSPEKLQFYTKWIIEPPKQNVIQAMQFIEIDGSRNRLKNEFMFFDIEESSFKVRLKSEHIGKVEGKGSKQGKIIDWSFKTPPACVGNEKYEKQTETSYHFTAEYGTEEAFESFIEGTLWHSA